ncbi:MAG: ATP-dependent sacrificial sulfur transferase LarE [Gemmatimonadales bacterium]|jgi:uncharacterized protein
MSVPPNLAAVLAEFPSVLIGYSGGVDSALLAVVATRVLGGERAVAALGVSPSLARAQHKQARDVARRFALNLVEVRTDELDDPQYARNPTNRCYFCKRELWTKLRRVAHARGLAVIADGTNADDPGGHRPGLRAADEHGIRSPLAEAGLTKTAVRAAARSLGLPIWDAPAAPCLASRVLYGLEVTPDRLREVEQGETVLRDAGVRGDLRVRHRGDEARIEVAPSEFARVRAARHGIGRRLLALGFRRVTLDLAGYRQGSLLATGASPSLEVLAQHPATR